MALSFRIGHPNAPEAGSAARYWRAGEVGLRTAERISFGGSSGGLSIGPRVWTWEGWARITSWPLSGTTFVTANLVAAPNAELKIAHKPGGSVDATASFWTENAAGSATEHAIAAFNFPIGTAWRHVVLQANYQTGGTPTFVGAVWLGGTLKGSVAPSLGTADIPHTRRRFFGLLEGVTDTDIDTTAPGTVTFDNWRLSNAARHAVANITPPASGYTDGTAPTVLIWPLRGTALGFFEQSTAGGSRREYGIYRYSGWNDEYRGPWTLTPNAVAGPF